MIADNLPSPAPVGRRFVACLTDLAGLVLLLLPVWGLMLREWTPTNPADRYALFQLAPVIGTLLYGVVAGRSYGKRSAGLMILTKTGEAPGTGRLVARALAKFPILLVAPLIFAWDTVKGHDSLGSLGRNGVIDAVLIALVCIAIFWYPISLLMLFGSCSTTLHDALAGTVVCKVPEPRGFPIEPIDGPGSTTSQ